MQDIASDGCFSLGMIAHFKPTLQEKGAWMYPRLFWETGVLGQVLYLEAHAVGISATGIGCFSMILVVLYSSFTGLLFFCSRSQYGDGIYSFGLSYVYLLAAYLDYVKL